ncbi:MAG: hypothetical protein LC746_05955 [Acidobacteria bacterium]|nr:hypothetical protein [Acidobacteriota bacterium]
MKSVRTLPRRRRASLTLLALLLCIQSCAPLARAQSLVAAATAGADDPKVSNDKVQPPLLKPLRVERVPVEGGAELVTIFGSLSGLPSDGASRDVPLVSILRDTLGDSSRENDRLRYVWMHTYTRPSFGQRAASAVPFLYTRVGSRRSAEGEVPPPVADLAGAGRDVWQRVFWSSLQAILIDPVSLSVKASSRTYRRNLDDYRQAHVMRALAVLSLYEETANDSPQPLFTPQERREISARLMLTQKAFGGALDDVYLRRVERSEASKGEDARGHNWELLRQRAEDDGLYFEPLTLPDGTATHALLWTTREDVAANKDREFESRFLNIASPWRDARLRDWQGYTEARYFDAEGRRVAAETPGARKVEMIPLALYGLDHPKIPALLVDFRDTLNPKGREVSRRVLNDVARNLFALSRFNLAYLLGRTVYDWVTDRRGMDLNQPSRLRAYSQLKLLLSLDASLDPRLREEINRRLELVSMNPLENGGAAEARLAREQYAALLAYARRPDGLAAKLDRDRRAELVKSEHGRAAQTFFKLANTLSFGLYTHREGAAINGEKIAALDLQRTLERHRAFLREVAKTSAQVEVEWNISDVRRSLELLAAHGDRADGTTSAAVARIFARTSDEDVRKLCLDCLYRINNESAKSSLVRIYRDETVEPRWRALSAEYLRAAARDQKRISAGDAKIIATIGGNE